MGIPFPLTLNWLKGRPELANGLLRQNHPPTTRGSFPLILNLLTGCRNRITRIAYSRFPLILNLLKDCRNRITRALHTAVFRSS